MNFRETIYWKILKQLLGLYIFWLIYFAITRGLFIMFFKKQIGDIDSQILYSSFWKALPLDISTASYLILPSFLIIVLLSFFNLRWLNVINKIYIILVIIVFSLIVSSELELYLEWKTKLNFNAISRLAHPSEIFTITSSSQIIVVGVITMFLSMIGYSAYANFVYSRVENENKRNYIFSIIVVVMFLPILIIGARGGINEMPINQSQVHFSNNYTLNNATVNSGWNAMHSISEYLLYQKENPLKFYDNEIAQKYVNALYSTKNDSIIQVVGVRKPNIVFIILEGWTADVLNSYGGINGVTPYTDTLIKKGVMFSNVYSGGTLSDQGIASLFSGYPTQPRTTIINQPEKYVKIPCISNAFSEKQYNLSFYYGGQLIYGNIKGYLIYNGFSNLIEQDNFDETLPKGKMGYHDEYAFDKFLEGINKFKEPFFTALFTLSTHSPYDIPEKYEKNYNFDEEVNKYLSAVSYTDKCIEVFMKKAKKQNWYNNTLFVFVADHSHNSYNNYSSYDAKSRKIPMFFYGEALIDSCKGMVIDKIGNSHDLPTTLLGQLDINSKEFKWSKNLLNTKTKDFAVFTLLSDYAWISPNQNYIYKSEEKKYLNPIDQTEIKIENDTIWGNAFMQILQEEYLKL